MANSDESGKSNRKSKPAQKREPLSLRDRETIQEMLDEGIILENDEELAGFLENYDS